MAISAGASLAGKPLEPLSPGAKITLQMPTDFDADDLSFAKQIGVRYVNTGTQAELTRPSPESKHAWKPPDCLSAT